MQASCIEAATQAQRLDPTYAVVAGSTCHGFSGQICAWKWLSWRVGMHGSRRRATLAWLLFSRSITVSRDVSLVALESYICARIYIYIYI